MRTKSEIEKWVRGKKSELRKAAKAGGASVDFKEWELRIRHPSQGPCTLVLGYFLSKSDGSLSYEEHNAAL